MVILNQYELINNTDEKLKEIESLRDFIDFAITYLKLEHVVFNVIIINNEEIHRMSIVVWIDPQMLFLLL